AVPELSEPYLHGVALAGLFLGLALQRRFALRLMTE
ncbi:MAG: ABC transporter, partial [Azospira oryzae]